MPDRGGWEVSKPSSVVNVGYHRLAYSIQEAAGALSVSTSTLHRAISHGLVKSTKMGASIRIPSEEVMRLARDGLPTIPTGYKRKTDSQTYRVGQAKTKTKTKPKRG
jgi:excisionase family DNA binding protein